jgi:DNA (cytosine-5)-methyltransferase 1
MRPYVLDLFCGAGGAARGFLAAGLDVIGVDTEPQPLYPGTVIASDSFAYLRLRPWIEPPALIFADPPQEALSRTLRRLPEIGLPWIVGSSDGWLDAPIACGLALGKRWHRHRAFAGSLHLDAPCPGREPPSSANLRDRNPTAADLDLPDGLDPTEFSEAVPPAFTRAIGRSLGLGIAPVARIPAQRRTVEVAEPYPHECPGALRRSTDLLIDGHPRSANTFMVSAFTAANPGASVTHHHHHAMTFEVAASWGVPALCLIRDPLDAAASWAAYAPRVSIERGIEGWMAFYSMIPDGTLLGEFTDVITDPGGVIATVNARFGTSFALPSPDGILDRVRPEARPSKASTRHREQVASKAPALLVDRARDLYMALTGRADLLSFA